MNSTRSSLLYPPAQAGVRILCGVLLLVFGLGAVARPADTLSLDGRWRVRLDAEDAGARDAWFARPLETDRTLRLPGTTDLAGLGVSPDARTLRYPVEFPYTRFPGVAETQQADERGFLVRRFFHLGPAWYERELVIPENWRGRTVTLFLERALWRTEAWIDGAPAGAQDSLVGPHRHRLGVLRPGRHRLTLRIDNRMQHPISTITHAYGPETQSRWNGVVGRIELQARPAVALERLEIHPAADRQSVRLVVHGRAEAGIPGGGEVAEGGERRREGEGEGEGDAVLRCVVTPAEGGSPVGMLEVSASFGPGPFRLEHRLSLNQPGKAWDEFDPVRYRIVARLRTSAGAASEVRSDFGFRQIERDGRRLRVNGRSVFLRGTLDCAVYPRTGHPPMELGEWMRVLGTVKRYGFNHVRFHTWCPPEAAFDAADRLGLYLMPEVAAWIDDWTRETAGRPPAVGRDPGVNAFVRAELRRMVETYGNHPSFAFLCIGNEFGMQGTDWAEVEAWVHELKAGDSRRLVTGTTARRSLPGDDLWVTHSANGKTTRGVGPPRTDWDFAPAAKATELPLIAHETGQRPVFPEYAALLPKFRGPLQPLNYLRLRERLDAAGLRGWDRVFERASARFQAVQYKAEHEAMRRTADYAGYQLLMLNDFTGQSEALVGILDPFWESKGVIDADAVRAWNAPTMPLARFARYTWSAGETFHAELQVAHHGPLDRSPTEVRWRLRPRSGAGTLAAGRLAPVALPTGELTTAGAIDVPLREVKRASALLLELDAGGARNRWPLWVYPEVAPEPPLEAGTRVAKRLDDAARDELAKGGSVLLLPHPLAGPSAARTRFESVYWSAGWWGNAFSMLGILCDPRHPALAEFPTEGHGDWQWHALTAGATTFRLEHVPTGFRPIVQAVPDFHYPAWLAQVFEVRVGPGRVLVCGYDLETGLEHRPAARQFRRSLLRYMASPAFRPRAEVEMGWLERLLLAADKPRTNP